MESTWVCFRCPDWVKQTGESPRTAMQVPSERTVSVGTGTASDRERLAPVCAGLLQAYGRVTSVRTALVVLEERLAPGPFSSHPS